MNDCLLVAMMVVMGIFIVAITGETNTIFGVALALGGLQVGAEWQKREHEK